MKSIAEVDTQTLPVRPHTRHSATLSNYHGRLNLPKYNDGDTTTAEQGKQKSFEEACIECNAISVDAFFDELNARIEKWPDHA